MNNELTKKWQDFLNAKPIQDKYQNEVWYKIVKIYATNPAIADNEKKELTQIIANYITIIFNDFKNNISSYKEMMKVINDLKIDNISSKDFKKNLYNLVTNGSNDKDNIDIEKLNNLREVSFNSTKYNISSFKNNTAEEQFIYFLLMTMDRISIIDIFFNSIDSINLKSFQELRNSKFIPSKDDTLNLKYTLEIEQLRNTLESSKDKDIKDDDMNLVYDIFTKYKKYIEIINYLFSNNTLDIKRIKNESINKNSHYFFTDEQVKNLPKVVSKDANFLEVRYQYFNKPISTTLKAVNSDGDLQEISEDQLKRIRDALHTLEGVLNLWKRGIYQFTAEQLASAKGNGKQLEHSLSKEDAEQLKKDIRLLSILRADTKIIDEIKSQTEILKDYKDIKLFTEQPLLKSNGFAIFTPSTSNIPKEYILIDKDQPLFNNTKIGVIENKSRKGIVQNHTSWDLKDRVIDALSKLEFYTKKEKNGIRKCLLITFLNDIDINHLPGEDDPLPKQRYSKLVFKTKNYIKDWLKKNNYEEVKSEDELLKINSADHPKVYLAKFQGNNQEVMYFTIRNSKK